MNVERRLVCENHCDRERRQLLEDPRQENAEPAS